MSSEFGDHGDHLLEAAREALRPRGVTLGGETFSPGFTGAFALVQVSSDVLGHLWLRVDGDLPLEKRHELGLRTTHVDTRARFGEACKLVLGPHRPVLPMSGSWTVKELSAYQVANVVAAFDPAGAE